MGEERAARETIACNSPADTVFTLDNHPHIAIKIACLYSSFGDKFICVHDDASGYIVLKFGHILDEALMVKHKCTNGEMSFAA